jgi:hypothetical protein
MTQSTINRHRSVVVRWRGTRAPRRYGGAVLLCGLIAPAAQAATFSSVDFDPGRNELIATMTYDGSNANHRFSVQWGTCRKLGNDGNHQIVAELLDNQWDDIAQQTFTTTVHVSLAGVNCHPALVTLRTAPKYEFNVQIP